MNKLVPFRSVLILGGAGFVGSNLAYRILKTTDAKVHIFDNLSRRGVHHNLKWLQGVAGNSDRLKVTIGDIRDAALVQRAVQVATEIYHFAAQVAVTTSIADPVLDFDVNVRGTLNVLEAARKGGRRPFLLFTSTNKVRMHGIAARGSWSAPLQLCRQHRSKRVTTVGSSVSLWLFERSGGPVRA